MSDRQARQIEEDEQRRAEVMRLPTIALTEQATLSPPARGDVPVQISVGADGGAVAMWAAPDDRDALANMTIQTGWASFPQPRASRPVTVHVSTHWADEAATVVEIYDLPLAHPHVQTLSDGRVLVVGARCRWGPGGPDRNAIVFDADGSPVADATFGDGIEHVLVSRSGRIWVAYFDEGVFGNYGWGSHDAPGPVGGSGLVRFSPDLRLEWSYPPGAEGSWGSIDDCYALNVAGDTAWACYYTDFPVVRIEDDTATGWHNGIARGITALAVDGSRVALYGGYGPDHDVLTVADRGQRSLDRPARYRLVRPDGSPLSGRGRTIGRGNTLHHFQGTEWLRLNIREVPR